MGGGGGSDDFSRKQEEIERRKQTARDAVNPLFGISPTGGPPNQSDFWQEGPPVDQGGVEGGVPVQQYFDQAGYDAAMARYEAGAGEAERNKSALDSLYGTVRTNAFDAGRRSLDERADRARRNTKFALAAQGLNGGSVDIDENATLNRTYQEGLIDLGGQADSVLTDLRGSDEQARLGLLQSIDAGMDSGSAVSSALQQMRVNADRAASDAVGTDLGDLFADVGLLYTKSNAARGRQAAGNWWETSMRPNTGNNGIVTGT